MLSLDPGLASALAALQPEAAANAGASDRATAAFGDLFLQAMEETSVAAPIDPNPDAPVAAPRRVPRGAAAESQEATPVAKPPAADEGQELLAYLVAPNPMPTIAVAMRDTQLRPIDIVAPAPSPESDALVDISSLDMEQPPLPHPPAAVGGVAIAPEALRVTEPSQLDTNLEGPPSRVADLTMLRADHGPATDPEGHPLRVADLTVSRANGAAVPHEEPRAVPQESRVEGESAAPKPVAARMPIVANEEATPAVAPAVKPGAAGESSGSLVETPHTEPKAPPVPAANLHLLSRIVAQAGASLDVISSPSAVASVAETVAAAPPPAADEVIAPQIVRSLRLVAQDGGGEARVRLNPEYLGEVVIVLKVDHGAVTASLQAESPTVRHWAETHEHVLRQSLSTQGLRLDQFSVQDTAESSSASERRSDDGAASSRDQQPPPRRPRPEAEVEAERFEVLL